MLDFKPVTIAHKALIDKYYCQKNRYLCDFSSVDVIMWAHNYRTRICEYENTLFINTENEGHKHFMPPIYFGDKNYEHFVENVQKIIDFATNHNFPFTLINLNDEEMALIEENFPDKFRFDEMRDNGDYIYLAESLITLKGKKLHGKRNHINKFLKEYDGRWTYEDLTDDNMREFFDYQINWSESDNQFLGELCAASIVLRNFHALGVKGGLLRLDGNIIGITLGSQPFEDMYIVHIEKANYDIPGAYQMINQQFALRNCQGVKYIDREEDLGLEGLRKSKLSYYPEFITKVYMGRLK